MNRILILALAACSQFYISCSEKEEQLPLRSYVVKEAFPLLSFTRPVDLQHSNDGTNRVFVVEQEGIISVFQNDTAAVQKKTFLDIRTRVDDQGNEEGLLGLAFHPNFSANGYFFVNYTASNPNRTIISQFYVSTIDPDLADPGSETIILEFEQPFSNHNGGQISFGPDGYLYIASGDGGSGGDPMGNGQSLTTLLGKILRIDVNNSSVAYNIPPDNPFINNSNGYMEEIYAYGLRNPWRFSFDSATQWLWTGDVGQSSYEEINVIQLGGNYGWNVREGFHCFDPARTCITNGLTDPVWEYGRDEGISITGGFVYRGSSLPELNGYYIYADFGSGRIWGLDFSNLASPANELLIESSLNISSFGVDQNHELYFCAFNGMIYKIARIN